MTQVDLMLGNCINVMKALPDNCVDSIVTDPPYELGFMGKSWDSTGIAFNVEVWEQALRVLKPGGHLIAFSGSRTYHRMAVAIEDAGFEIRDQIMWVYGSGFPKSLNVSKAIDKAAGAERERVPYKGGIASGQNNYGGNGTVHDGTKVNEIPIQQEAKQWDGWGTALKPAHEPMVLARKSLDQKTVASNVLMHGTGALNIDGSRIGTEERTYGGMSANQPEVGTFRDDNWVPKEIEVTVSGRWPANFIHDGSDEVLELFPDKAGGGHWAKTKVTGYGEFGGGKSEYFGQGEKDGFGSAARFFYCAKASKRDRNEGLDGFEEKRPDTRSKSGMGTFDEKGVAKQSNHHPTVKPTQLMRYLVKLVTPPGGQVLDPFMGSGSTGKGAVLEGFDFIGIELSEEYLEIAKARIEHAQGETEGRLL